MNVLFFYLQVEDDLVVIICIILVSAAKPPPQQVACGPHDMDFFQDIEFLFSCFLYLYQV